MASDDALVTEDVVRLWDRQLGRLSAPDPGLAQLAGLLFGDRRAIGVARPAFFTRPRLETERLAVHLVGSALAKVLTRLQADPDLLDELDISPAERALVTIDPGFPYADVNDRFDAFFSKRMGFVEVQGTSPGGLGYHDAAADAFMASAPFAALTRDYEVEPLLVLPGLQQALLTAWQEWGGQGTPTAAIVDWADAPLMTGFLNIRDHLRRHGIDTVIADPRDLRFEGGALRHGATTINFVYRRLLIQDCLARPDEVAGLVEAARAGAICMVNPFAADILGHKAVFDLITSGRHDFGLTRAERLSVANHVPWTRRLRPDGERGRPGDVDVEWTVEHQQNLVLKPVHDYGGHGVVVGWECDASTWHTSVRSASELGFIVQRRILAHEESYPLDRPGFPQQRFTVDNDPYTFHGRLGGVLVRLGVAGVTNVSAGGSMTPSFVVAPR